MIITLKDGDVTIALRPDLAPKHVAQIKELVREGAYDNVAFHRVIDGFMAQTGDVQYGDMKDGYDAERGRHGRLGTAGPAGRILQEGHFMRGVVGMARSQRPELGQLAVLHHVRRRRRRSMATTRSSARSRAAWNLSTTSKKATKRDNGVVSDPDRMIKVRIAADK